MLRILGGEEAFGFTIQNNHMKQQRTYKFPAIVTPQLKHKHAYPVQKKDELVWSEI